MIPARKTSLVWRKRVSKKRRAAVLEIIRKTYPDAADTGPHLEITMPEGDTKDIWIFMLCKDFNDIQTLR